MTVDLGREMRATTPGFEIRRADATSPLVEFRGYASVFNHPYDVAGGPPYGWTETVLPGAFKRSISDGQNRALLYHHDNAKVLATTRSGALALSEDSVGLLVVAQLDTRVGWINDLVMQVEAGTVDEMSIGFYDRSGAGAWNADYTERAVSQASVVETTICWAGANGATVAAVERTRQAVDAIRATRPTIAADRIRVAAAAARAQL